MPYRGGAPALIDLLGRRIDFMIAPMSSLIDVLKSMTVRPIAVASKQRVAALNVPTIRESGVPQYDDGDGAWFGMVVPKGTPREIVERLRSAIVEGIKEPMLASRLSNEGAYPVGSTPEEFRAFMKAESDRWSKAIQKGGISID